MLQCEVYGTDIIVSMYIKHLTNTHSYNLTVIIVMIFVIFIISGFLPVVLIIV